MTLDNFVNKLGGIKEFLQKEAQRIVIEEEPEIKQMNITRLYDTGQDTEGKIIGRYKPSTVAKRRKAGKPVPGDLHWTSFWAGEFFQGIDVKSVAIDKIEMTSSFVDYHHMEAYNPKYLGLNEENADEVSEEVAKKLVDSIVKRFS